MGNRLENYRKKVEFYLKEHQDNMAVRKLRNNQPLQKSDMQELEKILWGYTSWNSCKKNHRNGSTGSK